MGTSTRRRIAGAVLVAAAVVPAACSGSSGGTGGQGAPTAAATDRAPTYRVSGRPSPRGNSEGQQVVRTPGASGGIAKLPAAFPLPPGAGFVQVTARNAATDARMTVPDARAAYDFWATSLTRIGFTTKSRTFSGSSGTITAAGIGYRECTVTVTGPAGSAKAATATVHLLR